MREIVTVQVGDFANYIGSHFWNFQDELLGLAEDPNGDPIYKNLPLDMDILYRAGETSQGVPTYSPRVISIGHQGSLGALSSSGLLQNNTSSDSIEILTWNGAVSKCISEPHEKNLFLQSLSETSHEKSHVSCQDADEMSNGRQINDGDCVEGLETSVNFWTDYSKVQYHPQSLYEVDGSWIDIQKFDNYGIGKDVLSGGMQLEVMSERLRFFVEECDHIQGIQFTVDDWGGFSSIAAEVLENVADEYTNTPVLLYTTRDPGKYVSSASQRLSISRALHDVVSLSRLSSFCNLMVPIGLPSISKSGLSSFLHVDDHKLFHTSAIYAASIHAISVPFRMEMLGPTANSAYFAGAMDVGEVVHMLAGQSRQNMITIMDMSMPFPPLTGQTDALRNFHTLSPEINEDIEDLQAVESLFFNGAYHSGCHRATVSQVEDSVLAAYRGGLSRPMFSHLSVSPCPLPVPLPFPSIFGNCVGQHGELLNGPSQGPSSKSSLEVNSIPVAARLRSSIAVRPYIQRRLENLRKHGMARGAPGSQLLSNWGFGKEEIEDMAEHLSKMLMTLDPYSHSSSDSD